MALLRDNINGIYFNDLILITKLYCHWLLVKPNTEQMVCLECQIQQLGNFCGVFLPLTGMFDLGVVVTACSSLCCPVVRVDNVPFTRTRKHLYETYFKYDLSLVWQKLLIKKSDVYDFGINLSKGKTEYWIYFDLLIYMRVFETYLLLTFLCQMFVRVWAKLFQVCNEMSIIKCNLKSTTGVFSLQNGFLATKTRSWSRKHVNHDEIS